MNNKYKNSKNIKESFQSNKNTQNKKIALCFLIYDKINHEKLWYDWLSNVDPDKYTIYIHYKENKPLKYFEKYKLEHSLETCWGCLSVVNVQLYILENALKDSQNQHFVWLSGSCIPFKSFDYIYNFLNIHKSYYNKAPDSQVFPRSNSALKYIKKENIKKANMASIINRKHAHLFADNKKNINIWFNNINNVDEIALISIIYHYNLVNELKLTPNIAAGAIIFAQWPDMSNYKKFEGSTLIKNSPNAYTHISEEELKYLIHSKSLFGRKFEENCTGLENLLNLIK